MSEKWEIVGAKPRKEKDPSKKSKGASAGAAAPAAPVRLNILGKPIVAAKSKNYFAAGDQAVAERKERERLANLARHQAEEEQRRIEKEAKEKERLKQLKRKPQHTAPPPPSATAEERGAALVPERVKMRLTAAATKYPGSIEAQVATLAEFLESGFEDVKDWEWSRKLESALEKGLAADLPSSLISEATKKVIVGWLTPLSPAALQRVLRTDLIPTAFPAIAVPGSALPTPRRSQNLGYYLFIQLLLQAVPRALDPTTFALPQQLTHVAAQSLSYLLLQAAVGSPAHALSVWHSSVYPYIASSNAARATLSPLVWLAKQKSFTRQDAELGAQAVSSIISTMQSCPAAKKDFLPIIDSILLATSLPSAGKHLAQQLLFTAERPENGIESAVEVLANLMIEDKQALGVWTSNSRRFPAATAKVLVQLHRDWSRVSQRGDVSSLFPAIDKLEKLWGDAKDNTSLPQDLIDARNKAVKALRKAPRPLPANRKNAAKGRSERSGSSVLVKLLAATIVSAGGYAAACIYTACTLPGCVNLDKLCKAF